MRQAVEQRGGHFGVAEDAGPFSEGEIGRDDNRCPLVEATDQMEQELSTGLCEGQIAQLVKDDEVETREIFGEPSLAVGARLGFEPIDEIDGVEEPASGSRTDAASRDGECQLFCV